MKGAIRTLLIFFILMKRRAPTSQTPDRGRCLVQFQRGFSSLRSRALNLFLLITFAEFVAAVLRLPHALFSFQPSVVVLDFGIYAARVSLRTGGNTDDKKSSCEPGAREEARNVSFFARES